MEDKTYRSNIEAAKKELGEIVKEVVEDNESEEDEEEIVEEKKKLRDINCTEFNKKSYKFTE